MLWALLYHELYSLPGITPADSQEFAFQASLVTALYVRLDFIILSCAFEIAFALED